MQLLSYRYRIYPNKTQAALLSEMLADFCELYNAALEQRILAYEKGVRVSRDDQQAALPQIRKELANQGRWSATAQQRVIRKLDKTFQAFFARCKRGEKPGFPRFKPTRNYRAAEFRLSDGLTIKKSRKIGFVGIPGEIKVKWHRELPSKPKTAVLVHKDNKWHIIFYVSVLPVNRASPDSVGLDLGLVSLVALSNGDDVGHPKMSKRSAAKERRLKRAFARCKYGSRARKKRKQQVSKFQFRIGAARRDFLHKESRKIVDRFGRIAIESLNVQAMAKGILATQIRDASWGIFIEMLRYKAVNAGCELVEVNPRGTSQTCPKCGAIKAKALHQRKHRCPCGCVLDRDVAAAMVIHDRAFGKPLGASGESPSQPVAA